MTLFAFLAATLLLAAACGSSEPPALAATATAALPAEAQKFAGLQTNPENGKAKYATTCVACHGPDAKGVAGLGKDLTTSDFLDHLSDAEAALFLTKGRPASDPLNTTKVDMPPKGGNPALNDQDLVDIIAYLRTLRQ
jgi:disulfide bond formation protein DsbB